MPLREPQKTIRSLLAATALIVAALFLRRSPAAMRIIQPFFRFTPPMLAAIFIICIFSVYWSLEAKNSKPAASSESKVSRLFHLTVLNGGLLLLILSVPGLTRRVLPSSPVIACLGVAIEIAGFALAICARRALGSNWSGEVRVAAGHQLVRTGPYRLVRHPIYTAVLTMYGGVMLVSGQLHALLALILILLAYLRKVRMEERILSEAFGDEFTAWKRDSWLLLPPVY
ncbi:MAG TPA: isoprenylcysteine carboxylmethyltransferase family protein [Acidobacteriaceae bacterium]